MKICVVNGSPRKGNTYKATHIVLEQMKKRGNIEVVEFFLPKALPEFCCGCYNCIEKSEEKCPHSQYTMPILEAMREADGLIFTSPVYVLAESGGMKAFLDHYGYLYLPHRPIDEMFSKVAMVISTTAGAGTGNVIKAISRSLSFWGVKRIHKCGLSLFVKNWSDMKPKKQDKFERLLNKKADKFFNTLQKRRKLPYRLFTRLIFTVLKRSISGYDDQQTDKKYWVSKGWIGGKNTPFI